MPVAVVIVAAGAGQRVGAVREGRPTNKVLLPFADGTVLGRSVRTALALPDLVRLVVVVRAGEEDLVADAVTPELMTARGPDAEALLVPGGGTRHGSEWNAVQVLAEDIEAGTVDVVVVHDAARPLAPLELWDEVVGAARQHGGAVPAVTRPGLLTHDLGRVEGELVAVQTPQAFRAAPLLAAHRAAAEEGWEATDTAAVLARHAQDGARVLPVPGSGRNLKITWPEDVALAETLAWAED